MSLTNKLITEQNGTRYGNMIHPWLRRKEDLIKNTPSRRDGISYEEELERRQEGGRIIFELTMHLSHGKGEHGLSGVAVTLLNRFFNVHSLKSIDIRDVAAACVFLAGKNEDSPKKLKYVVNHLWQHKYPEMKQFPSEKVFVNLCEVVTFLEEMVLKTIAFDINVDLPHQRVLKLMRDIEKGRSVYKDMVKTAYYMASDVLLITDWSVRYSCASIAVACVNIAAFFHNIVMEDIVPLDFQDQWYRFQDPTMTRGEVDVMTDEFLDIYARNPKLHIGSLKKIDPLGKVQIIGSPPQVTSSIPSVPSTTSISSSGSSSNLKKMDLESYKRQKTMSSSSTSNESISSGTRPSFLPDVKNQRVVEQGLMEQRRQQEEYQRMQQQQKAEYLRQQSQRHQMASVPSSSSSRSSGGANRQRSSHEHMKRSSAHYEEQNSYYSNNTKKMRMDYNGSFVQASSSTVTTTTRMDRNGHFSQHTTIKSEVKSEVSEYAREFSKPAPVPLMSVPTSAAAVEPASAYKQMCMGLKSEGIPSTNGHHNLHHHHHQHTISSTQQISPPDESSPPILSSSSSMMLLPPPPPPPILPPLPPRRAVEEIEEGELV